MAPTIRNITIRIDMDTQLALDEFEFFRGETLHINFIVLKAGEPTSLVGNNMQLMLKDPNDAQFGNLAFSDEVVSQDLANGEIELEINTDTGEMNTFINYSSTSVRFLWELTAFIGAKQDRKLCVDFGNAVSDVNQCIEGPPAIAEQIANTLRWQGDDMNGLFAGTTNIIGLGVFDVYKPQAIDFYIKELTGFVSTATVSVGTDADPSLLLAATSLGALTEGETISFNLLNIAAVINELEITSPTVITATITIAGVASAMVIIPTLRGSRISDNDPCD